MLVAAITSELRLMKFFACIDDLQEPASPVARVKQYFVDIEVTG
jgi:hypothetical protein